MTKATFKEWTLTKLEKAFGIKQVEYLQELTECSRWSRRFRTSKGTY